MKKEAIFVLSLLISLSLGVVISAESSIGNPSNSITKDYGASSSISGWINMSFSNESTSNSFKDSLGNEVRLIDLLKKNSLGAFNCNTKNCSNEYETVNLGGYEILNIPKNESKLIGFKLTGNINKINSFELEMTFDGTPSCTNQLELDFLNDNLVEIVNSKKANTVCAQTKSYGCFNQSASKRDFIISKNPYCQRINLAQAPGYRIGAHIKKLLNSQANLIMNVYDSDKEVATCNLDTSEVADGEVYCDVNYSLQKPKDHYVCIFSDSNEEAYSLLGSNSIENPCGFYGVPPKAETSSYKIYTQSFQFGDFFVLNITNNLTANYFFPSVFENYIKSSHGSLNCVNGCIVPFNIKSLGDQTVGLNRIKVSYDEVGGKSSTSEFFSLKEISPKVTSGFQKIYLDNAGFKLPNTLGNLTYTLNFNSKKVFTEDIKISQVSTISNVLPRSAALGFPTNFVLDLNLSGSSKISKYEWDFDGDKKTTFTNSIQYSFTTLGFHNLTVKITDSNSKISSKTFEINVFSPKDHINQTISKIEKNMQTLNSQIKTYPQFYQESINEIINLTLSETQLSEIKQRSSLAATDAEYLSIATDLLELNVPDSITVSQRADNFLFLQEPSSINLDVLAEIGSDALSPDYSNDDYTNAILSWSQDNLDTRMNYKRLTLSKDGVTLSSLNVFEVKVDKKFALDKNSYFVLSNLDNIKFNNVNPIESLGYYSFLLDNVSNTIEFSTTEDVDFTSLPAFVSPKISELDIINPQEEKKKNWMHFVWIILLWLLIAFVVYGILQQWYKYRYEKHLFKDRNNLFNLVTYINNQLKKGVSEKEITEKLKKAKWSSEHISYAIKRYTGKRTGMIELIPIDRIFGRFKSKVDIKEPPIFKDTI